MHNSFLEPSITQPPRMAWGAFPDVLIHAPESAVKLHKAYREAKEGNVLAAEMLIRDNFNQGKAHELALLLLGLQPFLVSAHAFERTGVNAIPEVFADVLGQRLGWPVDAGVVQTNIVGHTGADGFSRLARQACFAGPITPGADYVMVDDFIVLLCHTSSRPRQQHGHRRSLLAIA